MHTSKEGSSFSYLESAPSAPKNELELLHQDNFKFAMQCNGYHLQRDNTWKFDGQTIEPLREEFKGQTKSFFGPTPFHIFFEGRDVGAKRFMEAFYNPAVTGLIRKYRDIDEDQAKRIAYILGGLVRYPAYDTPASKTNIEKSRDAVEYVARMITYGDRNSADAIAGAMTVYALSGGSLKEDSNFNGDIYHMAEAVSEDPIQPVETEDLGLSQIARLRSFRSKLNRDEQQDFPDISEDIKDLHGFPTVGAEFHFPKETPSNSPYFWQRLALLNMSQYQQGSYIQLSRTDRDVIEVRMNPSLFPVTIANWNHMRQILPELNSAYFTLTLNRKEGDIFDWEKPEDKWLLNNLRAIGMLSYATVFEDIPPTEESGEINFGSVYLGQTVRMKNGQYEFSGLWSGDEGDTGQFGIYAGFGNNLPTLAYYSSMAFANPDIITNEQRSQLKKARSLYGAMKMETGERSEIFRCIDANIQNNEQVRKAHNTSVRILEKLNP